MVSTKQQKRRKQIEEIRAIFVLEKYRSDDFFIGVFRLTDGGSISVLGNAEEGEFVPQMEYRLYGRREKGSPQIVTRIVSFWPR